MENMEVFPWGFLPPFPFVCFLLSLEHTVRLTGRCSLAWTAEAELPATGMRG